MIASTTVLLEAQLYDFAPLHRSDMFFLLAVEFLLRVYEAFLNAASSDLIKDSINARIINRIML